MHRNHRALYVAADLRPGEAEEQELRRDRESRMGSDGGGGATGPAHMTRERVGKAHGSLGLRRWVRV